MSSRDTDRTPTRSSCPRERVSSPATNTTARRWPRTTRALLGGLLAPLVAGGIPGAALAAPARQGAAGAQHAPAPIERRAPPPVAGPAVPTSPLRPLQRVLPPGARNGKGVPLAQWMDQHSQLSATDQQRALEREPGFRDLPKPTQDRMRQRLSELDNMTPEKRQRILARNEAMSRLSPDQRSDVRSTMQQLGALPQDQRRAVARTFHELRQLPPDQRYAALNSERYRGQFNEGQRATLDNLLRVEPLMEPMISPADRTPR